MVYCSIDLANVDLPNLIDISSIVDGSIKCSSFFFDTGLSFMAKSIPFMVDQSLDLIVNFIKSDLNETVDDTLLFNGFTQDITDQLSLLMDNYTDMSIRWPDVLNYLDSFNHLNDYSGIQNLSTLELQNILSLTTTVTDFSELLTPSTTIIINLLASAGSLEGFIDPSLPLFYYSVEPLQFPVLLTPDLVIETLQSGIEYLNHQHQEQLAELSRLKDLQCKVIEILNNRS